MNRCICACACALCAGMHMFVRRCNSGVVSTTCLCKCVRAGVIADECCTCVGVLACAFVGVFVSLGAGMAVICVLASVRVGA